MASERLVSKNVLGHVLIDAPHSALNMGRIDPSAVNENETPVKTILRDGRPIPYVSAQAWRYWWRLTLETKFGWRMSPIERQQKIAFTGADPFTYPDDDVFGYMRAQKATEGGTLARLSPLKTSPLISVLPQRPTEDFGVMSRHEGDPVPHVHQFYSTVLKGIFSLDLSAVGVFRELSRAGFKNLDEKYTAKRGVQEAIRLSGAERREDGVWVLPKETRLLRARDTINALPYLCGGAKQTLHLTDVTPKFIILAVISGGNHLFMSITPQRADGLINVEALKQVVADYRDSFLSDIFIGRAEGFQDSVGAELESLREELAALISIHLLSPKRAVEEFTKELAEQIE